MNWRWSLLRLWWISTLVPHVIHNTVDEFIPNRTAIIRPSDKEWMTVYIRYLIQMHDRMSKRYKLSSSPQHIENPRQYRTDVKCTYYARLAKLLTEPWSVAKEYYKICQPFFRGKAQNSIPALIDSDPISKAKSLNDYFIQNATESKLPESFVLPPMRYCYIYSCWSISRFESVTNQQSQWSWQCY